ncbi:MAG TPA: NAD(P)-binding protein [Gemmataceae bacterium]|nr:NAD(P)-binding protein [Gemmataceae bacterium]
MRNKPQILILGAGPAGIGAGIALGDRAAVLEGCQDLGGLCRTIELDGAVFDWGGHSFHTPHAHIRDLVFESLDMYEQTRDARCFIHGEMIPYPFQKHFHELQNPVIRKECASGLPSGNEAKGAENLEDYLRQRFGPGIAHHFLLPYNRKLWGPDLQQLAVDWVAERVAEPKETRKVEEREDGGLTIENGEARGSLPSSILHPRSPITLSGRRSPLLSDSRVAYPAQGGFGEILRALARRLPHLQLGQEATHIDPLQRKLTTAHGDMFSWNRLISTLPIPKLLTIMDDVPSRIHEAAMQLKGLPMALVLVVIGHSTDTSIQRIYSAGAEIPAHKIVVNHNSSPYLRSLPHHGIMAEVSSASNSVHEDLERQVVRGLQEMGLIRSPEVVRTTKVLHVPAAYPMPTANREIIVRQLKTWLAHRGIITVGRFGEWAYINSDEALNRGIDVGRAVLEDNDAAFDFLRFARAS